MRSMEPKHQTTLTKVLAIVGGKFESTMNYANVRWLTAIDRIDNLLLQSRCHHAKGRIKAKPRTDKHLSSIEVDPGDPESDPGPATDHHQTDQSCRCPNLHRQVVMLVAIELTCLIYQLSTSIVIYSTNPLWSWYFQPFFAPFWYRRSTLMMTTGALFGGAALPCVFGMLKTLDGGRARLALPQLLMKLLTIIILIVFLVVDVVLLLARGSFAFRLIQLAVGAWSCGLAGVGQILLGLERVSDERLPADLLSVHASTYAGIVPTNPIGAIWDAVSCEISILVALITFGIACASQLISFNIMRQYYCFRTYQERTVTDSVRLRRRYNSGGRISTFDTIN